MVPRSDDALDAFGDSIEESEPGSPPIEAGVASRTFIGWEDIGMQESELYFRGEMAPYLWEIHETIHVTILAVNAMWVN